VKHLSILHLGLGAILVAASVAAMALKPTEKLAEGQPRVDLESAVPKSFDGWRVDPGMAPVSVSPDVRARLDKIYDQLLSRTYVNDKGERIMLSIAYGGDQSGESMQVHRPEYCYAAQGFQVAAGNVDALATQFGSLGVRRVLATKGLRREPITYWLTVGDSAALPGWRRKVLQIAYGLSGRIPDGTLVRVSSINADSSVAYRAQDDFINALLNHLRAGDRAKVIGALPQ
jgi:EpsI family protein